MNKYTAVPIPEWDGYDYGDELRIVNPTWKNPERIEYRITRDINNLPRVQIDNSNGALAYIEILLDTGAVGSIIRKDAVKKTRD